MIFDVLVIIVMLISVGVAAMRGFIREILTLLGMLGGAIAAYIGGPSLIPSMNNFLGVEEGKDSDVLMGVLPYDILAVALAYVSVFVFFLIILSILSHFLSQAVKNLGLGAIDRSLGAVFGVVRGLLVLGLLYIPVYFIVEKENAEQWGWISGSQTHGYVVRVSELIISYIPNIDVKEENGDDDADALSDIGKKVLDMDLLKKEEGRDGNNELGEPPPMSAPEKDGYGDEFRENMDKLIEQVQPPSEGYND